MCRVHDQPPKQTHNFVSRALCSPLYPHQWGDQSKVLQGIYQSPTQHSPLVSQQPLMTNVGFMNSCATKGTNNNVLLFHVTFQWNWIIPWPSEGLKQKMQIQLEVCGETAKILKLLLVYSIKAVGVYHMFAIHWGCAHGSILFYKQALLKMFP